MKGRGKSMRRKYCKRREEYKNRREESMEGVRKRRIKKRNK
jgi:hypothetical protein